MKSCKSGQYKWTLCNLQSTALHSTDFDLDTRISSKSEQHYGSFHPLVVFPLNVDNIMASSIITWKLFQKFMSFKKNAQLPVLRDLLILAVIEMFTDFEYSARKTQYLFNFNLIEIYKNKDLSVQATLRFISLSR